MKRKRKFRWSAIGSALLTVVGVAQLVIEQVQNAPEVLMLLPPPVAAGIAIAGVVLQAVTKPVTRKPEER